MTPSRSSDTSATLVVNTPAPTPTSAGLFGLALEEFELTLVSLLEFADATAGVPNAELEELIDQLSAAIAADTLFNTFEGQMAIMLSTQAAHNAAGVS